MNAETKTILIAEDSATQALRLQNTLERHGFNVISAANGQRAIEAFAMCQPMLVISDIQMPVMDGYELCRAIKADPVKKSLPVMLLTSLSAPEDIIHGLECGADNFVVKPYDDDFLMARIRSVLANRALGEATADTGGIMVEFAGKRYIIEADRRQILNLLLSTYETAVKTNRDLIRAQEELKTIQAQLIEVEKLQAVSRLSAGVAHEVRNPLAILEMAIGILADEKLSEGGVAVLGEMREAVKRTAAVVVGLTDTATAHRAGLCGADLRSLIERALAGFERELKRARVSVESSFAGDLTDPRIDPAQIEQVFVNLFSNALDAMPEGGALKVAASVKRLGSDDVTFDPGDRSGIRFREGERAIVVEVRDTGHGIAAEYLGKVFDPFFSTRPTGKGMGLGLTVAKKLVELHHGVLKIRNHEGGGALVTVIFKSP